MKTTECICGSAKYPRALQCKSCSTKRIPVGMHPEEYDRQIIDVIMTSRSRTSAAKEAGKSRTVIDRVIFEYDIDFENIAKQNREKYILDSLLSDKTGIQNYRVANIRSYVFEFNLIEYVCAECGTGPEWNGKELILELDHVNGNPYDDRIENLRFLCPNCHRQTPTYGNRYRRTNLDDI